MAKRELSVILPPTISMVLALIGICLTIVGPALDMPILAKFGTLSVAAAMVGFTVYLITLLLTRRDEHAGPDIRLTTYIRAFFSDWATGMCGPLSVPFAALAVWNTRHTQKVLWGCLAILSLIVASYRVWRNERIAKQKELESLKNEIVLLKHRDYDDEHRRLAETKIGTLSEISKDLVYFLLHHGKQEAEELRKRCLHGPEFNDAVQRARDGGLVLGSQATIPGRFGLQYSWEINPKWEAVLGDLLGKRECRYFR